MPSLNRVMLIGRLTRDPEMRTTASGLSVAKFSIAVDRRFKNPQGERVTDFFDCSAFRQKAEFVEQYVHKGRLVAVEGSIELNEAAGQDGVKRRYVNIIVDNVETLDRAGDEGSGGGAGGGGASRDADGGGYYPDEDPDERPARPAARAGGAASGGGERDERPAREAAPARPAAARPPARAEGARDAAPAARPARAAKPAEPAYPADDFDDSDPFADE